jgi:uncharacterized membrane protein YgdD (TMEM256/DUF423 family)
MPAFPNYEFMNKLFLMLAAVFGALAVVAGAMLAHLLKKQMPEPAIEVYETAVRYQFYHVFALMATGILCEKFPGKQIIRAGNCFILGILLFCGSLYILSVLLTKGSFVPFALGILTPIGGFAFVLGWIFLAIAVWRRNLS